MQSSMSSEPERSRRASLKRGNVISPEPASDQSMVQNVIGFLQEYVPQAVSPQKEERREKRGRVVWAVFETGDANDISMEHHSRVGGGPTLPLLLILGFTSGYSVWQISPGGDAHEVYCAYGEGETARVVRLLKTPESCSGVGPDKFAHLRPIIAVVKKGRSSLTSGTVTYSSLYLLSLHGGSGGRGEEKGGDNLVRRFFFKTKPIVDVKCNRRVVVVVFQKRIVVLDAGTYDNRFVIKNNYPSLEYPCNPVALGTRWLAFSETKLCSKHQSVGGLSESTPPSVATTVFKNVKKGFSALTETISGLTGKASQPPVESTDVSQQSSETVTANIVSIIDTNLTHPEEVKLQDLGRDSGVIAHFVAHTGPSVHIAALAFNVSGTLLLSASTEGHNFHIFRVLPHPWLSSETAIHHLYTLYRGATSGVIQDVCFSNDSRWVAVSTLNGTTHVFPITPYGGDVTVRTHTSSRVVNQLSRFHTSAGIETFPSSSSSSHSQRSTASSAKGPSSQGQPHSPPREARDVSSSPTVMSYGGAAPHSWSNPRSLPLPSPVTVSALQQIKQPYLATTDPTGKPSGAASSSATSSSSPRGDPSELFVSLAGPDAICVRATFVSSSLSSDKPALGWGRTDTSEQGATYSLYIIGSNGILTAHCLHPQKIPSAPDGEDAPIELAHTSKLCWKLLSKPHVGTMHLPLPDNNPLITANNEYKKFCEKSKDGSRGGLPVGPKTDGEWLSQVEILTHAPPSRRLWMGPQFSFKAYQPSSSPSATSANILKTPSPPNTVISYASSLNSSNVPVRSGGGTGRGELIPGLPGPFMSTEGARGSRSDTQGSRQSGYSDEESAMMFPTQENPLVDLLEPTDLTLRTIHTSPLSMPTYGSGGERESSDPPSSDTGVVEVFGSWSKVAPRMDVTNFEVEKQLEEAMKEHESTSTVVSTRNTAKTGFHPLDGSQ